MEARGSRYTREEMYPIIETWQRSGKSKIDFCRAHGIIKSVFFYWCKKYREENQEGGFIPLSVSPPSTTQMPCIEILYPNGVTLKLPADTSAVLVRQYLGI